MFKVKGDIELTFELPIFEPAVRDQFETRLNPLVRKEINDATILWTVQSTEGSYTLWRIRISFNQKAMRHAKSVERLIASIRKPFCGQLHYVGQTAVS